MNPQEPDQYGDIQHPTVHNPLEVMQPNERIICEIKRHPIGMIGIYLTTGILLIVLATLALIVAPNVLASDNRNQIMGIGAAIFIVFTVMSLIFVFIANIVYWGNHWVVTSDSLTQITQTSLFRKQSAQLSLGNLEDVTVEKNGILAQLFNFGVLKAETAGERSKFMFLYCPNPNFYAQHILQAREQFEQDHRGGKQQPYLNELPTSPPSSAAAAPQDPGYGAYQSPNPVPQPPAPNYPPQNNQPDQNGDLTRYS